MNNNRPIQIGDRVVVYGRMETPVIVKDIIIDNETSSTILILSWGHFGDSKVYLHDEGQVWFRYSESN